jgi:hypothetical protein
MRWCSRPAAHGLPMRLVARTIAAHKRSNLPKKPNLPKNSVPSREFAEDANETVAETDIPARLDALPWSRFHKLVKENGGAGRRCDDPVRRGFHPVADCKHNVRSDRQYAS